MAASEFKAISGRYLEEDAFPGSTGRATAQFHGAFGCVNSSGFAEDYTSTSCPIVMGIVNKVEGQAGSTGDVIDVQGSINQGIHLVNMITKGKIDSIPFNSDLSADDIGKPVYALDNYTVTVDPGADDNMSRVGIVTKYYTSAKGEFNFNGYPADGGWYEKAWELTTSSSSIFMAIPNPLGVDVVLGNFECVIQVGASSAHAVAAGIAATSTTPASDVCITATAGISFGSTGVYGTAKTTNFAGNITWGATKFLTLSSSSVIGTGSGNGLLDGFVRYTYRKVL